MTLDELKTTISAANVALLGEQEKVKDLKDTLTMAEIDEQRCHRELAGLLSLWQSPTYDDLRVASANPPDDAELREQLKDVRDWWTRSEESVETATSVPCTCRHKYKVGRGSV